MGEHGNVNANSISLNRQAGQGAVKPDTNCGGNASHEYKPPKAPEANVPMPK